MNTREEMVKEEGKEKKKKRERVLFTFARNERYELADALLHALLCLLCDLGIVRQRILHDSSDWSKVANVSIDILKLVGL